MSYKHAWFEFGTPHMSCVSDVASLNIKCNTSLHRSGACCYCVDHRGGVTRKFLKSKNAREAKPFHDIYCVRRGVRRI